PVKLATLKPRLLGNEPKGWKPDSIRGSRHQRGYGKEWETLRRRILQRDRGLCQPCLKTGRVTLATQVDHVLQKASGGTDDENKLQSICVECRRVKTARESRGW